MKCELVLRWTGLPLSNHSLGSIYSHGDAGLWLANSGCFALPRAHTNTHTDV